MTIGVISYGLAAVVYAGLLTLLLTSWRGRLQGGLLVAAVAVSAAWAALAASVAADTGAVPQVGYRVLEDLRSGTWFLFLFGLLRPLKLRDSAGAGLLRYGQPASMVLVVVVLAVDLAPAVFAGIAPALGGNIAISGHLVLALLGLSLVEQLFRNTRPDQRWGIKYLCLGLGALFAYDFYLYADTLLFKRVDPDLWQARGFINAVIVPVLALSAARNPKWSLDVFVSRRVVFHTVSLLGAGLYLLVMATAGYYIRIYGGSWGTAAQVAFLFLAGLLLIAMLFSGQLRSTVKVLLSKHFFNYKYDYRDEWLKLARTLMAADSGLSARERAIQGLADVADSRGGMLWVRGDAERFLHRADWNMTEPVPGDLGAEHPLVRFLGETQWIIDLDEYAVDPERYEGLELPEWLAGIERAWLVVPLIQVDALAGFVILSRPRAPRQINWEDRDLLKTVGMQVASYVALIETADALMNARQFEAFNRLSSYVVHDLKNVSAQLSLVVSNAERHKQNPAFVDDMVRTVDNATQKLNRMLVQLRRGHSASAAKSIVPLHKIVDEAVATRTGSQPQPEVAVPVADDLLLLIDGDRLVNVLAHLIQNAQEATSSAGRVNVHAYRRDEDVVIEVADDGCGMDPQFVRERLFRPFDTTKGNAGTGIGAYEAREFVWDQGGDMLVESREGKGTTFRIRLPLYRDAPSEGAEKSAMGEAR